MLTLLTTTVAVFALNVNANQVEFDFEEGTGSSEVTRSDARREMRKNAVLAKIAEELGEEGGFGEEGAFDLDDAESFGGEESGGDESNRIHPSLPGVSPKDLPSSACPRCIGTDSPGMNCSKGRCPKKLCVDECWWSHPHDKWCHMHERGRQCWKGNKYYSCKKWNWAAQYW